MKSRPLLFIGGAVCLLLANVSAWLAWQHRPAVQVDDGGITSSEAYGELPPGEMIGTLMLGGLRGLAIDLLWLRAVNAKEDRRFYESVALFELISKVQPRFELVWEYMAWDMGVNIAYEADTKDDKFGWFLAGVSANAQGVKRNPRSHRLMSHLAWMFFNSGRKYVPQVEAMDWSPLLNPILEPYGEQLTAGSSYLPHELSARIYRSAIQVAEATGGELATHVRRLVPASLERSGNIYRNTGRHQQALLSYLDALMSWEAVLAHMKVLEQGNKNDQYQADLTFRSWRLNGIKQRQKAENLARELAPNDQDRTPSWRLLLTQTIRQPTLLWPKVIGLTLSIGDAIIWYDEDPPQRSP